MATAVCHCRGSIQTHLAHNTLPRTGDGRHRPPSADVIEMQTGEGKTRVAVMTACLNALAGKGVHILTFNDYLARRDAEWMRPVYEFLGLSVGCIQEHMTTTEKRLAYRCDVTYATAKEIGFDYLRSCMAYAPDEVILRDLHYAIVDEADAILIDEARNPLVFSGNIAGQPVDHHNDLPIL